MDNDLKIKLVKSAIKKLFEVDRELIERDLCERCLVNRLALHLSDIKEFNGYFVDCEFNRAFNEEENTIKQLSSEKGNYVDIIIHKRSNPIGDNLLCFEIKKRSNRNKLMIEKDELNLRKLTKEPYFYSLGFQINLGTSYSKTQVNLYSKGEFVRRLILNE